MHHKLKCHPAMFRAVRDGVKTFEVRLDDRAFQCGDTFELNYYDANHVLQGPSPEKGSENLNPITGRVGFVLRGGQYGIGIEHVAFSLLDVMQS